MKMPAVEALAASKLRKAQLMPTRNRGCALAPWDFCILCDSAHSTRPHAFRNHRERLHVNKQARYLCCFD